jgi:hypothetical protein
VAPTLHLKLTLRDVIADQWPAIDARASSWGSRYRHVHPITTPSSTSQSVLTEPRGIRTSSSGPTSVFVALKKTTGSVGAGAPEAATLSA